MDITVCTTMVTPPPPPPPPPVAVPVINMTLSVSEAMLLQVILNKIGGPPDHGRVRAVSSEMRKRLEEVLGGVKTYRYGEGSIHFHGTVEDFNSRFGVADVEARLLRSNRANRS